MEEKNIIILCGIVVLMEIKFNFRIMSSDNKIDTINHIVYTRPPVSIPVVILVNANISPLESANNAGIAFTARK